jgi:DNA-binding transcriptional ArsR family regulator
VSRSRDVFGALADPTRRMILERLLDRHEMSAGALAAEFAHISRPAVSKHLGVLRAAGLVRAREDGREVFYALDPAPLAAAYDEWWARFAPLWDERLARLKRNVERAPTAGPARAAARGRARPR